MARILICISLGFFANSKAASSKNVYLLLLMYGISTDRATLVSRLPPLYTYINVWQRKKPPYRPAHRLVSSFFARGARNIRRFVSFPIYICLCSVLWSWKKNEKKILDITKFFLLIYLCIIVYEIIRNYKIFQSKDKKTAFIHF